MIADGGEATADIEVLPRQSSVLGAVASQATVWRALDEITAGGRPSRNYHRPAPDRVGEP